MASRICSPQLLRPLRSLGSSISPSTLPSHVLQSSSRFSTRTLSPRTSLSLFPSPLPSLSSLSFCTSSFHTASKPSQSFDFAPSSTTSYSYPNGPPSILFILASPFLFLLLSSPYHLDAQPAIVRQSTLPSAGAIAAETLDEEFVRELAGGSMSGFVAGLAVSVFSKTLVLMAGMFMMLVQFAAQYGIDLIAHLRISQRLKHSRIIAMLRHHPTFKFSFAMSFTLTAFAHL